MMCRLQQMAWRTWRCVLSSGCVAGRPAGPRSKCTLCTKSRLIDRRWKKTKFGYKRLCPLLVCLVPARHGSAVRACGSTRQWSKRTSGWWPGHFGSFPHFTISPGKCCAPADLIYKSSSNIKGCCSCAELLYSRAACQALQSSSISLLLIFRAKAATCTAGRVKQVIDTSLRSQAPLQALLLCSAWITLFDFPSPRPGPSRNAIAESYWQDNFSGLFVFPTCTDTIPT